MSAGNTCQSIAGHTSYGQWCHQIHSIRLERCGAANDVIRSTVSDLKGVVMLYVLAQNPHGSGLLCGRTRISTPGSKSVSRHCWPICPSSKHTPSYTIYYDEVWTVKHFTGPEYMWHNYTHDELVLVCCLLDVEYLSERKAPSWPTYATEYYCRAYSRFAPSQWETALLCNDVSHWLGASLESALYLGERLITTASLHANRRSSALGCFCNHRHDFNKDIC